MNQWAKYIDQLLEAYAASERQYVTTDVTVVTFENNEKALTEGSDAAEVSEERLPALEALLKCRTGNNWSVYSWNRENNHSGPLHVRTGH